MKKINEILLSGHIREVKNTIKSRFGRHQSGPGHIRRGGHIREVNFRVKNRFGRQGDTKTGPLWRVVTLERWSTLEVILYEDAKIIIGGDFNDKTPSS